MSSPDLRMVPVAAGAVVAAAIATAGHRTWWAVLAAISLCMGLLALLRGHVAVTIVALVTLTVAVTAGARQEALHHTGVGALSEQRAMTTARVIITGDCRVVAAKGPRPQLAFLPARTVQVTTRGRVISQRAAITLSGNDTDQLCHTAVGQHVEVTGRLTPVKPTDPQAGRIAVKNLTALTQANWLDARVNHIRDALVQACRFSPQRQRALVPSLVVGDTAAVDSQMSEEFKATALTHLMAVSGANLASTMALLWWSGSWLGLRRRWLRVMSVFGVVLFVLICRSEPSVMRAAAMGIVALSAAGVSFDRSAGIRSLAVAMTILAFADPWLVRSIGFWLSVAATAGILWWSTRWVKVMQWATQPVAMALVVPWAAQLATQPLVTSLSHSVSATGLLANLAAAPFVGPATILGMSAAIAASLWVPLGVPAGWLAGWCVQPVLWIAHVGATAPAGQLQWPVTPLALGVLAGICLGLAWITPWVLRRWWATILTLIGFVLASIIRPPVPGWPGEWQVVVCDVGQGSATLVNAGHNTAVLIDAGPEPQPLHDCVADLHVNQIPLIVLSHYHADHVGGIDAVLTGFGVNQAIVSDLDSPVTTAKELQNHMSEHGIEVSHAAPGEIRTVGEATVEVLDSPLIEAEEAGSGESSKENDSSVLVRVSSGGLRALVTGDIEPGGQQAAMRRHPDLGCDVLVMPHHGSARQDRRFWTATGARLAVASAGLDNSYGHPSAKALNLARELGMQTMRTDRDGSIAIHSSGDSLVTRGTHGAMG